MFLSPFDVVFSFHDVVEPDLVFVAPDQLDILTDKNIQGTPALVIEILSPSTRKRDRQAKYRLYERTGVREYWLVDPELDAVTDPPARGRWLFPPSRGSFPPPELTHWHHLCWRAGRWVSRGCSVKGSRKNSAQIGRRGARMARREERAYQVYVSDEQRRQPGCLGGQSLTYSS